MVVLIETDRLLLRPLVASDLEELVRLHEDREVTRFIRPMGSEEAQARLLLAEREWRERGHGILAVLDRGGGRFLGRTGLKYWPQFEETEIGWVLRREEWGHGYATEAAHACLDCAFESLELPYITAMIHADNERSNAVARRLGMSPLRTDILMGDEVVVHSLNRRR